jgi:hypothetical protein
MDRLYLKTLHLRKGRDHYTLTMVLRGGSKVEVRCDGNLGSIMSGVSAAVKVLSGVRSETAYQGSATNLDVYRIAPLTVLPYRWQLIMEAGPYRYTCNLDDDLEHVLFGFAGAMKFFALKRGLVVVEEEVTRNAEWAHEQGLLH